jgi:predicted outer membrane protein
MLVAWLVLASMQGIPVVPPVPMNDAAILGARTTVDEEEIESAQWAVQHASTPAVRSFARSLLRGHGSAQNSAEGIADRLQIRMTIPADTDEAIIGRHNAEMASLRAAHGRQFDRVFLEAVRDDHMNEIAKVTDWYIPAAKNDSVRIYLHDIMPTLNRHQMEAEKLLKQTPATVAAAKRGGP